MNNRTQFDSYKSIKAPAELKTRVFDSLSGIRKPIFNTRVLSAIAACLVLIACISFAQLVNNSIEITVEPISVATASRDADSFTAIIKIERDGKIVVDASTKDFAHVDEEGKQLKTALDQYKTDGVILLGWKGITEQGIFTVNDVEYKISYSHDGSIIVIKNK